MWSHNASVEEKYLVVLDVVVWALFDNAFDSELDVYIAGKVILSGCIIVGVAYNIYVLVQVLNIMNILRKPKTKYKRVSFKVKFC